MKVLFDSGSHKCLAVDDLSSGSMVQANQHVIVDGDEAIVLDPGGHKIHTKLFAHMASVVPLKNLKYVFFSHQDPDIIAAANAWLMMTDARAYLSELWMRFIPHFGVDELVVNRIQPVPDGGLVIPLGSSRLRILPAHFLHSAGNFQLYDETSKILYSGDLGASLGQDYDAVQDFDTHVGFMEGFHKRYMPSNKALRMWAAMVRTMDVSMIAPQHGAWFPTPELAKRFVDWAESLECGLDLMGEAFVAPTA